MTMEESVPESVIKKQQNSNTRFLPKESERLEITKLPKILPMTFKALIQPFRTEVPRTLTPTLMFGNIR